MERAIKRIELVLERRPASKAPANAVREGVESTLRSCASLLLVGTVLFGCDARSNADRPRHLLLVSIDTMRADAIVPDSPCRASTPTLDELATRGRRFENVWSHVPLTLPSHATLFTGRLPQELGLHDNAPFPLRGDVDTLATLLHDAGFATDAVIGGQPLGNGCGLERGFEQYDVPARGNAGATLFVERNAVKVTDRALAAWQRPATSARGRFLFVHYFDAHHPYLPPANCLRGDPDDPAARYRGEITFVDREFSRLLARIRASGERCLVVVTSDHGEGLGDGGESTHGFQLLPSTLRVPLIVAEIEGARTSAPAPLATAQATRLIGLVDLLPTMLRLLEVAAPATLDAIAGRALQEPEVEPRAQYVESLSAALQFGWAQQSGVRGSGAFLLHLGADPPPTVGDLRVLSFDESDERCLVDASRGDPSVAELAAWRERFDETRTRKLPRSSERASQRALQSLGYLPGSSDRSRHDLLPLTENALRPSPLARRDEIEQLLHAVARLEAGEALGAASSLSKLLKADPEQLAARFFRARARLALEELDQGRSGAFAREAVADLARVVATAPDYPGAALLHAKALALAGDFDAARAALTDRSAVAAELDSEAADREELLGSLLLERARGGRANPWFDAEQGFEHLLRAIELDPERLALARKLDSQLAALARTPDAPPWVAVARERFRRRRGRRYRARPAR